MNIKIYSILICIGCIALISFTKAIPQYQTRIPNGNNVDSPCDSNDKWQGVGHWAQGGAGPRNPFGHDFRAAAFMWTKELCKKDSDGDGKSNGQELGDPTCVWTPGSTPSRTSGITHPGICEPPDSDSCKDKNGDFKCPEKWDCPSIHEPGVVVKDLKLDRTHVPPKETTYICQAFDVSSKPLEHVIATYPIVDNSQVLHHMIIYGCTERPSENLFKPMECGMGLRSCRNLVDLWGFGQPKGNCYPKEAGAPFGEQGYRYVVIQLHWNNPAEVKDWFDGSGFTLHFSPKLREHSTGVMMYGQTKLQLPQGQEDIQRNSTCHPECSSALLKPPGYKILWGTLHMHLLGRRGRVTLIRDGKSMDIMPMGPFDYNTPEVKVFDPPLDYKPGDAIHIECHYNSQEQKKMIFYGDGTQDEMCFVFFQYYPHDLTIKNKWPHVDQCFSWDRIDYCSASVPSNTPFMVDGCNIKDVFSAKSLQKYQAEMEQACDNTYGLVCLDECMKFLNTKVFKDPCFQGTPLEHTIKMVNQGGLAHHRKAVMYIRTCKARMLEEELSRKQVPEDNNGSTTALVASLSSVAAVAVLCAAALLVLWMKKKQQVSPETTIST